MADLTNTSTTQPGRSASFSQNSENSQTAQEYIASQLQLEDDAREVLPYQFDTCSQPLGPLRQNLWSCLTCNPPPADPSAPYTPAGICYSCHVSCHGEHTLVELFGKRNMVCDCGTKRIQSDCPCTLRINSATGMKGDVRGEEPATTNHYDQNYRNKFCGCGQDYNAHEEKGTMFQCLGLGTVEDGGCGEDWWHPECLVGLPRDWYKKEGPNGDHTVTDEEADDEPPLPPGFPDEDEFEHFICHKCTSAFPWIKRYVSAPEFLPPLYHKRADSSPPTVSGATAPEPSFALEPTTSKKRRASESVSESTPNDSIKRQRTPQHSTTTTTTTIDTTTNTTTETTAEPQPPNPCKYTALPPTSPGTFSLFLRSGPDWRSALCHCPSCFPLLPPHPHLLTEEDVYEPPLSHSSPSLSANGSAHPGSHSSRANSLLSRGEAALSNLDRVRAIEGVMVYNHLKEKVKGFLKPFAESGRAVGAEDIKAYFEELRGDGEGIRGAREGVQTGDGEGREGGNEGGKGEGGGGERREQSGY
ncbi:hypothetical protein K490DRAFT_51774 [Saccharata proteae CBS 121410]|uniref:UBR-type domain-containing protein n=1 Tax=Saccharata proteae CBS 121410 TaxID=1314787 RepID=A0A9P4HP60_9PEZI|nr:hypothetical protein K490DRAFT_51774 [Saccharata proteae CBS 121410]